MRGRVSPGPSVGGGSAFSMSQARFYYLHPLLAGPTELWGGHFARAAAMGFDAVVVAPPFRAGQRGDLFRTADHDRLDPRLGDASAGAALAQAAEAAADRRLRLYLDLVLDEVAAESPLARGEAGWYRAEADDEPPDPRRPPPQPDLARLCPGAERSGLAACWAARLAEWADAGVAGFRCLRPQRVPAGLWRELIAALRRRHPDAEFIAWTAGLAPAEAAALGDCGFDYTACCCRGWDYRAGGFAETLDSLARLAPPLLAPEAPFERPLRRGPRQGPGPRPAGRLRPPRRRRAVRSGAADRRGKRRRRRRLDRAGAGAVAARGAGRRAARRPAAGAGQRQPRRAGGGARRAAADRRRLRRRAARRRRGGGRAGRRDRARPRRSPGAAAAGDRAGGAPADRRDRGGGGAAHRRRGGQPRGRRRPLRRQAPGRRDGRGHRRRDRRRPRPARRGAAVAGRGRGGVARGGDDAARQRPLDRALSARPSRPAPVHRARLEGPLRQLCRGAGKKARRRPADRPRARG